MFAHELIEKEMITKIENYIRNASAQLHENDDKEFIEFYSKCLDISKTAQKAAADNNEKWTYLYSALTQWANKLTFRLFEYNRLTPELKAEYDTLDKQDEAAERVQSYIDERNAAKQKVIDDMKPIQEEQAGIDIFTGILSGKSIEEAKAQYQAYQEKMNQAMGA